MFLTQHLPGRASGRSSVSPSENNTSWIEFFPNTGWRAYVFLQQ